MNDLRQDRGVAGPAGPFGDVIMAHRRGGFSLNAPRLVTFVLSLALVLAAALSLRFHLPVAQGFVASHRFWLVVGGYALLALGVVLPML